MNRKNRNKQIVSSFVGFLVSAAILSMLMPQKGFSETENRYLKKRPSFTMKGLLDGSFGTDYETYLSDQFPGRDAWIGMKVMAERARGRRDVNGVYFGKDDYLIEKFNSEDIEGEQLEQNLERLSSFVLYAKDILGEDRVRVMLVPSASQILTNQLPFLASPYDQSQVTKRLGELLEDNMSAMETRGLGGAEEEETADAGMQGLGEAEDEENADAGMPGLAESEDKESADRGGQGLAVPVKSESADTRRQRMVVPVEAMLAVHRQEDIYYKTDHHWTALGAYYGYRAWAESVGVIPWEPEAFSIQTVSDEFLGTVYSKVNLPQKPDSIRLYLPKTEPEYQVFYDGAAEAEPMYSYEALEGKDKYAVYMDGNHGLTKIQNPDVEERGKGRTLLIIKDSFAHSFAPFVVNHFEETYMVDLRYFNLSLRSFMEENGMTDVLILYQIPGFSREKTVGKLAR